MDAIVADGRGARSRQAGADRPPFRWPSGRPDRNDIERRARRLADVLNRSGAGDGRGMVENIAPGGRYGRSGISIASLEGTLVVSHERWRVSRGIGAGRRIPRPGRAPGGLGHGPSRQSNVGAYLALPG